MKKLVVVCSSALALICLMAESASGQSYRVVPPRYNTAPPRGYANSTPAYIPPRPSSGYTVAPIPPSFYYHGANALLNAGAAAYTGYYGRGSAPGAAGMFLRNADQHAQQMFRSYPYIIVPRGYRPDNKFY